MKVLAVGAHPDDVEFRCAGTLKKYADRGDEIFIAVGGARNLDAVIITSSDGVHWTVAHEHIDTAAALECVLDGGQVPQPPLDGEVSPQPGKERDLLPDHGIRPEPAFQGGFDLWPGRRRLRPRIEVESPVLTEPHCESSSSSSSPRVLPA